MAASELCKRADKKKRTNQSSEFFPFISTIIKSSRSQAYLIVTSRDLEN